MAEASWEEFSGDNAAPDPSYQDNPNSLYSPSSLHRACRRIWLQGSHNPMKNASSTFRSSALKPCIGFLIVALCIQSVYAQDSTVALYGPSESQSAGLVLSKAYLTQDESQELADDEQSNGTASDQLQSGMKEIKTGMEQLQQGLETVGKNLRVTTVDENWKVAVFGSITGEMVFAEQRPVIPSGIVLLSPDFGRDTPTVEVHGKQSSLGAALVGPNIGGLKAGGLLLTYFYGEDYLADQPGFFIVRGYGELKNDFWRFAVGADADIINPLSPQMLDFNAGQGAGNMGFFRGQFRVERYFHFGCHQLTTQLALGNPITTSFDGNVRNLLEDNGWPNVDMRIAIGLGPECERNGAKSRPVELGVSGLLGQLRRTGTPFAEIDVWAVGADAKVALTDRCGFQGEFFSGQGIGNYNAGIVQIFNPFTLQPIRTTGGWGEFYVHWTTRLHSHFGCGIDDPLDSTLSPGLPTRNAFAFANIICDVTKNLEVGFEVDRWETDFTAAPALGPLEPGDNEAMVYRTRVSFKF